MNDKGPYYTYSYNSYIGQYWSIGECGESTTGGCPLQEDVHYDGHTLPLLPSRMAPSPGMERGPGLMDHAGGLIVGEWPLYITNPFSVSHA